MCKQLYINSQMHYRYTCTYVNYVLLTSLLMSEHHLPPQASINYHTYLSTSHRQHRCKNSKLPPKRKAGNVARRYKLQYLRYCSRGTVRIWNSKGRKRTATLHPPTQSRRQSGAAVSSSDLNSNGANIGVSFGSKKTGRAEWDEDACKYHFYSKFEWITPWNNIRSSSSCRTIWHFKLLWHKVVLLLLLIWL